MIVRTAFFGGQRDQKLMDLADCAPLTLETPLATLGDVVIAIRPPVSRDWVNGEFVGDHECPTDVSHVHGAP